MDVHKMIKKVRQRVRDGSSMQNGGIGLFCMENRLTRKQYSQFEYLAIKEEAVWLERQDRAVLSDIMTPLELRLTTGIPADIFYGYSQYPWWAIEADRMFGYANCVVGYGGRGEEQMYPCYCLKREGAGRYLNWHQKLQGPLAGWYAGIKCESCKGTGIILSRRPPHFVRRLRPEEATRLLELEKKARVA